MELVKNLENNKGEKSSGFSFLYIKKKQNLHKVLENVERK